MFRGWLGTSHGYFKRFLERINLVITGGMSLALLDESTAESYTSSTGELGVLMQPHGPDRTY